MPKQTSKSGLGGLAARLGDKGRQAFDTKKAEDVVYNVGGDLPAGIENGIAQITDIRFGQYKEGKLKGKDYFIAQGIVVTPDDVDGVPVKGLRTMIMEPCCDTPESKGKRVTLEDHLGWILNEIKKLDADLKEIELEDLETTCEALQEAAPYFRFRTWKGEATKEFPNPRVNHQWAGSKGLENYVPDSDGDGVDAGDEDAEPADPEPAKPTSKTLAKAPTKPTAPVKAAKPKPAPEPDPEPEESEPEAGDDIDLDELAKQAAEGDEDAARAIVGHGALYNVSAKKLEDAPTWKAAVAILKKAIAASEAGPADPEPDDDETGEGESEGEPEGESSWVPAVEEVYYYKPVTVDPKTKKKTVAKKPVECEVTAVDEDKETVSLKNLDTKAAYKAVPWASLEQG